MIAQTLSSRRACRAFPASRSPGVDLDAPVPRHWFGGNVVATHVVNGVNLLFPAGERFFVRSVNHYLDRGRRTRSCARRSRASSGRRGATRRSTSASSACWRSRATRSQRFLRALRAHRLRRHRADRRRRRSRLATTAACEHFTAILAENALAARASLDRRTRPCARSSSGTRPRRSSTAPSPSTCSSR